MPLEVVGSTALSSEADRSGAIMRGRTMDRVPRQFQLDVAAYRLLQDGRPVRLERQPMELLILLASRPGELVTRQEITARFWGEHVFVDIEGSINRIVAKVRLALHDNPEPLHRNRRRQGVSADYRARCAEPRNCRVTPFRSRRERPGDCHSAGLCGPQRRSRGTGARTPATRTGPRPRSPAVAHRETQHRRPPVQTADAQW
jgi:hypothetical protein